MQTNVGRPEEKKERKMFAGGYYNTGFFENETKKGKRLFGYTMHIVREYAEGMIFKLRYGKKK